MNTHRRMWQRRVGRKGLLARAKGRRRWLSAPERRVTFSIRHEQSFALLPCSIYLPFFWRTSPRVRALNSTPPVNSPDGRLPGISQILLFTILPDARCMPRATILVRSWVSVESISLCTQDFLLLNRLDRKIYVICLQNEHVFIINESCHFIGSLFYSGGYGIFCYICSFWFY